MAPLVVCSYITNIWFLPMRVTEIWLHGNDFENSPFLISLMSFFVDLLTLPFGVFLGATYFGFFVLTGLCFIVDVLHKLHMQVLMFKKL